jgi:hypothetical protein
MTQDEIIEMAKQAGFVEKDAMFRSVYLANIKDLEAFAKLVAEKAFEQGFYAGFKASGEGWNGEYPFRDKDLDIQQDESVQHELKEAIKAKGQ